MESSAGAKEPSRSKHLQRNISDRLQRSIQLLDSSTLSPSTLLKTSRQPRSSTSFTPQNVHQAAFDLSSFVGNGSLGSTLSPTLQRDMSAYVRRNTDIGKELSDTAFLKKFLNESSVVADDHASNLAEDADPANSATSNIFEDFKETFKNNSSEDHAFDLLDSYIQLCQENVTKLNGLKEKLPYGQNKFSRVIQMQNMLQQEMSTWELLRILYHDRLQSVDVEKMIIDMDKKFSIRQFVDQLFEHNSSLRQKQLVVKWLELNSSRELSESKHVRFEYFTDKCVSWEKTLNSLKQKKISYSDGFDKLVDEMDPDAPIRQNRSLADLDQEDDWNFLKSLYIYIRCGQFEQAERLCHHCGQYWRAATIQGWRFYHDPNYDSLQPGGIASPPEGNFFRDIWKLNCWKMSQHEGFHSYERALYAALCGNLRALLPTCLSWEEYVWAYFRVMIDTEVELEIRSNFVSNRESEELPREYWDQEFTPEVVFQEISASPDPVIQQESKTVFHVIQKYIILNDYEGLIEEMHEFCKKGIKDEPHILRFAAHLVLFLRVVGYNIKEEVCISILELYVKLLIEKHLVKLVALYTATLPSPQQVTLYAQFLQGILDCDERQLCLQIGEDAGLDVPTITKTVVENIRHSADTQQNLPVGTSTLSVQTTLEDRKKIDSIEWLIFDASQRGEALRQGNAIIREFLIQRKIDAAQNLLMKIPSDSIEIIVKQWRMQCGETELSAVDANATREYLCILAYLQAQDSYKDWFEHFHNGKPDSPKLAAGANFSERVAFEHRQKQHETDLSRWQHTLELQTKTTTEKLYNVLLFIDGGWMIDQRIENSADEGRQQQMKCLRESCLPEITIMLHSILHSTGKYKECLQLADIIASEQHQLYKVFQKQDLQHFLNKLRESSLALLDSNFDPLGYPF
ncbi:hypothetical protein CHUAL_014030 [Chamberlinius hualienensis]